MIESLTTAVFTVVALAIALVALRAFRRTGSRKVGLLALGFALFALKGVFFTVLLFTEPDWERASFVPGLVIDVLALLVFYAAIVHRTTT